MRKTEIVKIKMQCLFGQFQTQRGRKKLNTSLSAPFHLFLQNALSTVLYATTSAMSSSSSSSSSSAPGPATTVPVMIPPALDTVYLNGSLLASQTVVNLKALCKCLDPTGTLSGLKTKTEWANRVLQLLDALDTPPLFYEEKYHYFYSGHVAENEEYVANINKMQDHYTACVLKTEEINKALEDIAAGGGTDSDPDSDSEIAVFAPIDMTNLPPMPVAALRRTVTSRQLKGKDPAHPKTKSMPSKPQLTVVLSSSEDEDSTSGGISPPHRTKRSEAKATAKYVVPPMTTGDAKEQRIHAVYRVSVKKKKKKIRKHFPPHTHTLHYAHLFVYICMYE